MGNSVGDLGEGVEASTTNTCDASDLPVRRDLSLHAAPAPAAAATASKERSGTGAAALQIPKGGSGDATASRSGSGVSDQTKVGSFSSTGSNTATKSTAKANEQGVELLKQGQYDEAVRQFKVALAYEPKNVQILNNIGLAHAKKADFEGAYTWYERAYLEDTRDVETLFSLAWVERKRQRFSRAKELFEKVLEANPDHAKALYLLGDILKSSDDFDGAAKQFERLIQLDSSSVDGHMVLAQCCEKSKQYPRAVQLYGHVLQLAPKRIDVAFFLGRVYYLANQFKQCALYLDRVPDDDEHGFEARAYTARACRAIGDHNRAILNAERAARCPQCRRHPEVMHFLAEEHMVKGDHHEAEVWLSRFLDIEPKDKAGLSEISQLMCKQSRWSEAEIYLARLNELDRNSASTLRSLAQVRFKQKKFDACKQACENALRIEALNAETIWLLAESHRLFPGPGGSSDHRWLQNLRFPADVSAADACQVLAKAYLLREQSSEALHWMQKLQHHLPTEKRIGEAIGMLVRQSGTFQEVVSVLDQRSAASPSTAQGAVRGAGETFAVGRVQSKAADSDGTPLDASTEALERLLRRAEREGNRGAGSSGLSAAAERLWQDVLTNARGVVRQNPKDVVALRCVARGLLALGGDISEIKDYAHRATVSAELGEDSGSGFTLGHELHTYLGAAHERDRDWPSAETNYARALCSKPGDEQAMLGLARTVEHQRNISKAQQLYEQVCSANPSCAEANLRLAEISLSLGKNSDAHLRASRAVHLSSSDAKAHACLGRACVQVGLPEEAIVALEQALALQHDDVHSALMLANIQQKAGNDQDAISWFKRALDLRPGDYECCLNLGRLHARRGFAGANQALHYLKSALQCKPGAREARTISLSMADVHSTLSNSREARAILEALLRDNPEDVEIIGKLIELYRNLKDNKGALQCHRRLEQLNALTVSTRLSYSEVLLSDGQLQEARVQVEKCLKEDPHNTCALLKLAAIWKQDHMKENNLDEARKTFEMILNESPSNAEALEGAAYCHRKLNNLDKASELYISCVKERPTAEGPLYYLGDILYRLHRYTECQHYLERLVKTSCAYDYKIGAYYTLAKSHISLERYAEAEAQARIGLELKPNFAHFLFILALVKNRIADYDAAIAFLEQALKNCESSNEARGAGNEELIVECNDWLAQSYERKQNYKMAMSHLDISLSRDPSHVSSLITKGHVHIQLKQFDQAESCLRRALAVEKSHALALVRLGYCKLLSGDHTEASSLLNRAMRQRGGTLAMPTFIKGTARVYLALASMATEDFDGALDHLREARQSHKKFGEVCSDARKVIVRGEYEGLVTSLRSMNDLDVNAKQAWDLVHLMAREVELDVQTDSPSGARTFKKPAAPVVSAIPERRQRTPPRAPEPAPERRQWTAPAVKTEATPQQNAAVPERRAWTQAPAAGNIGGVKPFAPTSRDSEAHGADSTSANPTGQAAPSKGPLEPHEDINYKELIQGDCLGAGAFGAVYKGTYRNRVVAIKKLFCEDGGNISDLQLEELEKEVAALRALRHPRLISFIGACLKPPDLCIITEFMPGGSLHHLLHKAKTALSWAQQHTLGVQVCEGVAFLHGLAPPFVHRDLKPLNIILDLEYNAKLCDFGLTQSMEKTHISLKDGGNGGSPRYMAPECYVTNGKITEKVDVWALGCILIEIFGGPLPYNDCTNIQQIVTKILFDKQGPYVPHNLHSDLRSLVEDCFVFELKQRTSAQDAFQRVQQLRQ
eukprot:TRINITY_DN31153_c0_g1_i2.p1 TRINITY_DN31153_c0_g1~~TRINITY_DN31153_c0_g1_i2.p1  ORF type:complete len:1751 (-),score=284.33 TRINITY_DN31153_c0_g1_i2:315-5567(-)